MICTFYELRDDGDYGFIISVDCEGREEGLAYHLFEKYKKSISSGEIVSRYSESTDEVTDVLVSNEKAYSVYDNEYFYPDIKEKIKSGGKSDRDLAENACTDIRNILMNSDNINTGLIRHNISIIESSINPDKKLSELAYLLRDTVESLEEKYGIYINRYDILEEDLLKIYSEGRWGFWFSEDPYRIWHFAESTDPEGLYGPIVKTNFCQHCKSPVITVRDAQMAVCPVCDYRTFLESGGEHD